MTNTINEVETFTVHDKAGLDALPEGAKLIDNDGDRWEAVRDGEFRCLSFNYFDSVFDVWNYLPATVTNPEVLGDFHTPNPFKVGDRVVKSTVEHLISNRGGYGSFGENEADKGDAGYVDKIVHTFGRDASCHVTWDKGNGSVISPDNLGYEPRFGDTVRIVDANGASGEGTLVPREQANLYEHGYTGYEDHPYGVDAGHFTYFAKEVEVIERSDLADWERELLYSPEVVVEEVAPFAPGDAVEVAGWDPEGRSFWDGPATVTKFREDGYVIVYSYENGCFGGFAPGYIVKHDAEDFVFDAIEDFEIEAGMTIHDEEALDLLPDYSVIVPLCGGLIPRTKLGGDRWAAAGSTWHGMDEATRRAVRKDGALVVFVAAEDGII
jgi:hypothetical protein